MPGSDNGPNRAWGASKGLSHNGTIITTGAVFSDHLLDAFADGMAIRLISGHNPNQDNLFSTENQENQ